jgi:hypothetical protein
MAQGEIAAVHVHNHLAPSRGPLLAGRELTPEAAADRTRLPTSSRLPAHDLAAQECLATGSIETPSG